MKKQVLFFGMMLLGLTSATATTAGDAVLNGEDLINARYRFVEPIVFIERGVEFLIFPDGSFDFNTEVLSTVPDNGNYYYRRSNTRQRRSSTNRTYGAPGTTSHVSNRGVLVRHDRLGRVRRIGNVFINYDRQGRIKRAGSVYMSYRRNQLKQVGGLHILYNRHGDVIGTRGYVNFNNQGYNVDYGSETYDIDWSNDHIVDDDHYYYKKNGKLKKQKKLKS
ncbi:hypothetical protein H8K90_08795 [Winogradskyella echinorum]|uniref:MORN repeat variant n=1 Tax=Winogradskyella echinorum TaxID=538189 RepID=A0ABR6Y139_9FLAO|nr:hypothetical protein [Winogradskyella echinorum]MBC3846475.1 hypothetical protein [Winogradskyella echinorum]MBC5750823.1 hypothetical protein [Winogradskyella echinorum]